MSLQKIIKTAECVVIKIGSVLIRDEYKDCVRKDWFGALAQDIQELTAQGKKIIIVSSGGIALGRSALGIKHDTPPSSIPLSRKQAASAVGQFHLFSGYYDAFSKLNIKVAQVLLTMSETENRRMHLNARETLSTLMKEGIVPIINENDTVSTGEIRFGDNDRLAVRVAQMINADLVVLLSTIDGLYTNNPSKNSDAQHIAVVKQITDEHTKMAGEAVPGLSTGGMKSKIKAANSATRSGIPLVIGNGKENHAIKSLFFNENTVSTLFLAKASKSNARKRWIQAHLNPKGHVLIDDGAYKALKKGKSLLPIGVKHISGIFNRGDILTINTANKKQIGVGISAYSSKEAQKIIGKQSSEIAGIIGYKGRKELVHRNDMALNS